MSKNKKKKQINDEVSDKFAKMIWNIDEEKLKEIKKHYEVKDKEEFDKVRQAQLDIKNSDAYKEKSFFIPDDVTVTIPVSGKFKKAIQDTLNFCFSRMTKDEVIKALMNIQTNYKGIRDPEKDIYSYDLAVWTLMNLITEINFQAQEQGKLVNSDETIGDQMTEFIESMESNPDFKITNEELDKITKDYKKGIFTNEKEFKFQEEEKPKKDEKSDTNED